MRTRILIADRSEDLREVYRLYLEGCGYEVETVANGQECLTKLIEQPPAVLVLECGLPWGDADGVVARMLEDWDIPPVPVVLIDNEESSDELTELIADQVVAYLLKPFHMHKLLECLVDAERPWPVADPV